MIEKERNEQKLHIPTFMLFFVEKCAQFHFNRKFRLGLGSSRKLKASARLSFEKSLD